MTIRQPGLLFRTLILGAQGVFYNLFCEPLEIVHRDIADLLTSSLRSLLIPHLTANVPSFRRPS